MSGPANLRRVAWRNAFDSTGEDNGDENHISRIDELATSNTAFDQRVRALLGVRRGKVKATLETDEINVYGCETWETSESVTISVGSRSRTFGSLPALFARLEAIDLEAEGPASRTYCDTELVGEWLGKDAEFVFIDGQVWRGRLGNAKGRQVLLIGGKPAPGGYSVMRKGEEFWTHIYIQHIDLVREAPAHI